MLASCGRLSSGDRRQHPRLGDVRRCDRFARPVDDEDEKQQYLVNLFGLIEMEPQKCVAHYVGSWPGS